MKATIEWPSKLGGETVLITVPRSPIGMDGGKMVVGEIKFQDGPIREVGVNGCQIDDILRVAQERLIRLNLASASVYNRDALHHINQAIDALDRRTADREARGVEGTSKP